MPFLTLTLPSRYTKETIDRVAGMLGESPKQVAESMLRQCLLYSLHPPPAVDPIRRPKRIPVSSMTINVSETLVGPLEEIAKQRGRDRAEQALAGIEFMLADHGWL